MKRESPTLSRALSDLGLPGDATLARPDGRKARPGEKTLYVLTPDELEDMSDTALIEARRGEETFPFALTKAIQSGENSVRAFRKHRGLTMQNLATACGANQGYLSEIERGLKEPSLDLLRRIAAALDVDVANLVT